MPVIEEFIHKYTRRKHGHDYYSPCHYHIILKKAKPCKPWGTLTGNPFIKPGEKGCVKIDHNLLGKIIGSHIFNLPKYYPLIQPLQYMVMPDHVHIFLRVKERIPYHLGYYIGKIPIGLQLYENTPRFSKERIVS